VRAMRGELCLSQRVTRGGERGEEDDDTRECKCKDAIGRGEFENRTTRKDDDDDVAGRW
jgi:hypothetical protein